MPYIKQNQRKELIKIIDKLSQEISRTEYGKINFVISKFIHNILEKNDEEIRYNDINNIIGVLECVKQEFYRKIASPYEDDKKEENGSVSYLDYEDSETVLPDECMD